MRVVIQRVKSSKVRIDGVITASIGSGLLLLTGIARDDTRTDADYLATKIVSLRIFPDHEEKMNLDIRESKGSLLIVSNFTVYADCRKGRRPGFDLAARLPDAKELYDYFVERCRLTGVPVQTGVFQAHMLLEIENDGPTTLICESR